MSDPQRDAEILADVRPWDRVRNEQFKREHPEMWAAYVKARGPAWIDWVYRWAFNVRRRLARREWEDLLFAQYRREHPDFDAAIRARDLGALQEHLNETRLGLIRTREFAGFARANLRREGWSEAQIGVLYKSLVLMAKHPSDNASASN